MKNPLLLPLVVVLLLAVSLLATTAVGARLVALVGDTSSPYVECEGDGGVYAANSTYEANCRRLAGLLLAEADAPGSNYYTDHAVGYWPNRPQAIFFCRHRRRNADGASSGDDSACAACIAGAFLEVERECPYHRKAAFYSSNCTLEFSEFPIFGTDSIFSEFCHASSTNLHCLFFFNLIILLVGKTTLGFQYSRMQKVGIPKKERVCFLSSSVPRVYRI